ncbi:hypothetical protein [Pectobacterium phage Nobby_B3]|uniref:Peptidase M28 domain-containing protein n=6 Tax=Phimunavirus nobby TaxID=2733343 RepID=A0A3G8FIW9_9CAUD|nr:peptidase [Pectobacterium phage Nobby]AZF94031.1 hypothetical protein [Pectobacterium phage Astalicious]AZF94705.1 hypothetical protein [Pectobacterium phage Nobby_B1]AZF94758.1 hypothetical protein [Pectobacterium phage Nobby_B2]AZF94818.1 hypothetical protein [Pectobacterium phage Nobby_B3]AZF94886.1 hypothetical protein [Pectobacterium phage Nobby_B4]
MQHKQIPEVLRYMLELRRPYGSVEETIAGEYIEQFLMNCETLAEDMGINKDRHGNIEVRVGEWDNGVVFTSHLDTVHHTAGTQDLFLLDLKDGLFIGAEHEGKESVLGADDAAGIFLMTELIKVGVSGRYMFFIGEECGGIGSSAYVQDNPEFSANMVVSFDRRGQSSIITHQGGWRTCSTEFAVALAGQLTQKGVGKLQYRPDDAGLYTDSREFADIVPECTNVSVGYFHEHTAKETLNLTHLLNLRDALLKVEWEKLPIKRVPEPDIVWDTGWMGRTSAWYDTPKDNVPELRKRVETLLNKEWDTMDSKLRQLVLDIEEHLNEQI